MMENLAAHKYYYSVGYNPYGAWSGTPYMLERLGSGIKNFLAC